MKKITLTIDDSINIDAKSLARMLTTALGHINNLDITTTPETIDIRKGKEFSEIELSPTVYRQVRKLAKELDVPMEQILRRGLERMGEPSDR